MPHRLLLLLWLFSSGLSAQETLFREVPTATHEKDKTEIEVEALFSMAAPTGFLPIRVTVVNQRLSDGKITLQTNSQSGYSNQDSELTSEFELAVPKQSVETRDFLVPLTTVLGHTRFGNGSRTSVSMSGSFGRNAGFLESNYTMESAAIMMSERLHTPNASKLNSELQSKTKAHTNPSFSGRFDPTRMPEDWRAYSGYDAFLMTDTDWGLITPAARNAIFQWCRLGGHLVIYRLNAGSSYKSLGIETTNSEFGFGTIDLEAIDRSLDLDAPKTVGRFIKPTSVLPLNRSIAEDYSSTWPLHAAFGGSEFSYGIFIVVLIAFGILVGPLNLFVFAKSGKRHKLFITTPLISLGTSLLLILLILLKDGTGGRGQRVALIEVRPDDGENNAYVLQEQISRTGVLLGGSFDLSESATITPVPLVQSAWSRLTSSNGGGGMRYSAEFEDGKLSVTGDWFQSRSEQGQLIRSVVPTRGRIEIKSEAGAPVLLSTFEFPIEELYYRDRSNGFWIAKDLQPGAGVNCTSITEIDYNAAVGNYGSKLGSRHRGLLKRASNRPDHYVAIAFDPPAIESFDAINWVETQSILTGPTLR